MLPKATEVSNARALVLCATGALIGLGIAAYGLFTASGTSTASMPPENIATVNRRPVLRSDFLTQLEMETGKSFSATSREEQLRVLDEMVREELLVQRALELDFGETDQNVRNALATSISDQAVAEVTTSEPSVQQLKTYYEQNPGKWATEGTMSLRDFVVTPPANKTADIPEAARVLAARLRSGTPAADLIDRHEIKEVSHQVDEYYFTLTYRLGAPLFDAVRTLAAGAVSEPQRLKDGVHIVQVEKNEMPKPYSFEQAYSRISSDYNADAQAKRMANTIKFLRNRSTIVIASEYASDYKP
jgi:parvulin-like peptidyl-prolyl isomerase